MLYFWASDFKNTKDDWLVAGTYLSSNFLLRSQLILPYCSHLLNCELYGWTATHQPQHHITQYPGSQRPSSGILISHHNLPSCLFFYHYNCVSSLLLLSFWHVLNVITAYYYSDEDRMYRTLMTRNTGRQYNPAGASTLAHSRAKWWKLRPPLGSLLKCVCVPDLTQVASYSVNMKQYSV
jgi:hypothetical protein